MPRAYFLITDARPKSSTHAVQSNTVGIRSGEALGHGARIAARVRPVDLGRRRTFVPFQGYSVCSFTRTGATVIPPGIVPRRPLHGGPRYQSSVITPFCNCGSRGFGPYRAGIQTGIGKNRLLGHGLSSDWIGQPLRLFGERLLAFMWYGLRQRAVVADYMVAGIPSASRNRPRQANARSRSAFPRGFARSDGDAMHIASDPRTAG